MNKQNTPLHVAAQNGNVEIVKILLNSGANATVQNTEGKTALHLAVESGHTEVVELLSSYVNSTSGPIQDHASTMPPNQNYAPMPPAQLPYFDSGEQSKKLNFWLYFYLVLYVVVTLAGTLFELLSVAAGPESEDAGMSFMSFVSYMIVILSIIATLVGYYHLVVRLWSVIPEDISKRRTTPKQAAWLSFIPVFNLYWFFVVFHGLAKDMNTTASRYGKGNLFNADFVRNICIFWAIYGGISIFDILTPETMLDFRLIIIHDWIDVGLTVWVMVYLCNGIKELMQMRQSNQERAG